MRLLGRLLGWSLVLAIWAVPAAADADTLGVEAFGAVPGWEGPQKVQADAKGRVFLLKGETLEVYPVLKNGALSEPVKLETARALGGPVLDAAMGPGPGDWLLLLPLEVRLFLNGKEKNLPPLPWRPYGVGFLRGTPIVSVLPRPAAINGVVVLPSEEDLPATAPVAMELGGDRWSAIREEAFPKQRDVNSLVESWGRLVLGDRQGKLWMARSYAYVVDRCSAAGRLLTRVEAENGRAEHRKAESLKAPAEVRSEDRKRFQPFLGVLKISDLTEGLDHRIYLLVQGPKGVSLDRYDPVAASLERVELGLALPGNATLAAGRDALFLVAHSGAGGRWRISWQELEGAKWKTVPMAGSAPATAPGKKSSAAAQR